MSDRNIPRNKPSYQRIGERSPVDNQQLITRRKNSLINGAHHFYDRPLHLVRGSGVWLWDDNGKQYLDCYNNVASVGHCHPQVVAALSDQASLLNTHTRYLHSHIVEASEALIAKMPFGLDAVCFVCTGTEANDLAVQIARRVTGHFGILVTESSYHGNSALVRQLSTCNVPLHERESFVGVFEPPNIYRNPYQKTGQALNTAFLGSVDGAIAQLADGGHGTAAVMMDVSYDSNGILNPPKGYIQGVAQRVRRAGGLVIMDEVQAGYARLGSHFWGFEREGITPDIVTVGKPMGAGHPVAAVIIQRRIMDMLQNDPHFHYFNTFGGNPVSALAAKTVLQILDEENLMQNALTTGAYLHERLMALQNNFESIGDIQGSGLFWGIDLVKNPQTKEPFTPDMNKRITSRLAEKGVLIASTGRYGNVLKIRPPLVFKPEHVDLAVQAIHDTLIELHHP